MRNILKLLAWRPGRPTPGHQELIGLQFIRGLAALMVIADHVSGMAAFDQFYGRHLLHRVPEAGLVGVDLFFCLSGFIILYVSVRENFQPIVSAKEFIKRRFARIIPFLWVVIGFYAILKWIGPHEFPAGEYLRAMTLCPVGTVYPPLVWTLRHEFLFYLVFALLFLTFRRAWPLIALWVLSPVAVNWSGRHPGQLVTFLFDGVNMLFGLGLLVCAIFIATQRRWKLGWYGGGIVFLLVVLIFFLADHIDYKRITLLPIAGLGVLCAACVFVGAGVREARTIFGQIGVLLGDASYAIYLTHPIFITVTLQWTSRHLPKLGDWSILLIASVPAILGGIAMHFVIERPVVSFAKRLMHRRKSQSTEVASS